MSIIIPAIFSDSVSDIQRLLDRIHTETHVKRVQIDVTDPDFVHELTVAPIDLIALEMHALHIDIHLMTNDPINDVIECSQVPGIHQIIAQIEHMSSQRAFVEHVSSFGIKSGLSIDYTTPLDSIDVSLLGQLSSLQIVDIEEGAQGRAFGGPVVLSQIRAMRTLIDSHPVSQVECIADGGITEDTARLCRAAGADQLVVGSYFWKSESLTAAIAKLEASVVNPATAG